MPCQTDSELLQVDRVFRPLDPSNFLGPEHLKQHRAPMVFRGLAAHWPAVQRWRFSELAQQVPDREVQLVAGNRELESTTFVGMRLSDYLRSLDVEAGTTPLPLYLKEFDLLDALPELRRDLRHAEIFPRGVTKSLQSWIGPAGARTGLHRDYLDNLAVQVLGRKRFYLAHPNTVERLGALSGKYDAWAQLARCGAQALACSDSSPGNDYAVVDLEPGDVLFVPALWWHEVHNLTPSILFGGFYGPRVSVAARWLWVRLRHLLHQLGCLGQQGCTCHPQRIPSDMRIWPFLSRWLG